MGNSLLPGVRGWNPRFGIEIECVSLYPLPLLTSMLRFCCPTIPFAQTHSDFEVWQVTIDNSIDSGENFAAEIKSPICEVGDFAQIIQVVSALRSLGCYTNLSCGLHVHVSANSRKFRLNASAITKQSERLPQRAWRKRRKHCNPNRCVVVQSLANNHVEIRVGNGTLNRRGVIQTILSAMRIADNIYTGVGV